MGTSTILLASVVATMGGMIFGYEMGIISGALLQLKAEFRLSCVQQEALVSSFSIGALLASIVGGCLIDHQGRRNSILFSNVLVLTGSLVLLVSSYTALVVGRITVGFATCIAAMSCCIFVSEMVSPERRGFVVTLYEGGVTVGILAAYGVNYILSEEHGGWRWMFGLAVAPTLIQLASIGFLSLAMKASEEELISASEVQEEEDSTLRLENKVRYSSLYLFQRKDNMRTRTGLGLGLVLFQQFTGQPNVLFYASTIFHSVGFHSNASAVLASVGLGFVKVIATLTSMVLSDKVGRRPLLISGCSVMALSLITIGLLSGHSVMDAQSPCGSEDLNATGTNLTHAAHVNQSVFDTASGQNLNISTQGEGVLHGGLGSPPGIHTTVANWIVLLCMMAVVGAYAVGFGPLTWVLLSEIFPPAVKGRAFAFINCFNWAANMLVTFTFLNAIDVMGVSGMFLLYGALAVAASVFLYFLLPETKGKSLEEIDKDLRLNRFQRRGSCCSSVGGRMASARYQRVRCHASTEG